MTIATGKSRVAFQRILFATDLSYLADAAVPYVLEMARLFGSTVHAVHVRRAGATWGRPEETAMASLRERLAAVPCEVLVREGEIKPTLLGVMDEKRIDLTVVSTHGWTGLGRVLLGSVAEGIFREAMCPVLTVGPHLIRDRQRAPTFKEILFATEMTPVSSGAAKYATSLAQECEARLTILHVQSPKSGDAAESEHSGSSLLRSLREIVPPEIHLSFEPYCLVERGDPAEKILDVAARYRADLIVMGIRPHAIAGATHISRPTAHRVVAGAPCPVLTARR